MSPLDPRLLDALRADRPAPDDARLRVRARLEAIVPGMGRAPRGGGSNGSGAGGGSDVNGVSVGALGSHLSAMALFVVGGLTGAVLFSVLSGSRPPRVVYVDRIAPSVAVAAVTSSAPLAIDAPPRSIALAQDSVASAAATSRGTSTTHASRFATERRLLDEARAGLMQGEPERAVERLERHRVLFPDGMLVEERDAMRVEALVQCRRYDEARALAGVFRARLPGSLFLATVDAAIASIP